MTVTSGRLVFKIGEAFPAADPVAVFLVALSNALNDLVFTNRLLVDDNGEPDPHSVSAAERQFLLRLSISHVWELRESIKHARKRPEVEAFLDALPVPARAALGDVENVNTSDAHWIRGAMEHVRNQANHYGGKWNWDDLEWAMRQVADVDGAIEMTSPKLIGMRLMFADEIALQHLARKFPEFLLDPDAKVSDETISARTRTMIVAVQQATSAAINFTRRCAWGLHRRTARRRRSFSDLTRQRKGVVVRSLVSRVRDDERRSGGLPSDSCDLSSR